MRYSRVTSAAVRTVESSMAQYDVRSVELVVITFDALLHRSTGEPMCTTINLAAGLPLGPGCSHILHRPHTLCTAKTHTLCAR